MKHPLVSVVIPCYNYARFLREAVQSIQQQTYTHWECIIVNDGSTDDSLQVAQALAQEDQRIRIIDQQNAGLSAARNAGIEAASGDFIQLLDADDLISKTKFETQVQAFEQHPDTHIVYGDFVLLDQQTGAFHRKKTVSTVMNTSGAFENFCMRWERGFTIPIHAYLFRTRCFREWSLFTKGLPTHEDIDLQIRLAIRGATYLHVPEIVAVYRQHGNSMVNDLTKMHRGYLQSLRSFHNDTQATAAQLNRIRTRYTQEYTETLLNKIRGKKLRFGECVSGGGSWNLLAVVLLPFNSIRRMNEVQRNKKIRQQLGEVREDFPAFHIFS